METVIRLLQELLQALELTHLQMSLICVLITNEGATGENTFKVALS